MPDEPSQPCKDKASLSPNLSVDDFSSLVHPLSLKASLAVYLSAGLLFFLLSHVNYLLVHTLIELSSIALLTAVFLIGWNTRHLVRSQFFLVLAVGFLASGLVDLLHTLAYRGMQIVPVASDNLAVQLWLVARTLSAAAFLCAIMSLGRRPLFSARGWLFGFLFFSLVLTLLVWPLQLFPACVVVGEGLTSFKFFSEYVIVGLFSLAGCLLLLHRKYLSRPLLELLLLTIVMSVLSEMVFSLAVDAYSLTSFLGHYLKFGSVVLIYYALVEATLHSPFDTLFREMGQSYEELNLELTRRVAAEKQQELVHQEAALLYRMSRAMHSTLNLDELVHLMLSAATGIDAGGFERAMFFTVNKRTGMLQGMLGVSQEMAPLILPAADNRPAWEALHLDEESREAQRVTPFNQKVVKQRLSLDDEDNALAKAFLQKQVVLVARADEQPEGGRQLAAALELGPYACAPLFGREQIMGVLLVVNPLSSHDFSSSDKRFLELFANHAGSALDNASLVKRLEIAHTNLQDVQEQLLHGEKMAVLGEMAAQVAHELRNPLVSIGGFAQRLARQELQDPKANEYAGIIAREVKRMEEVLGNILAFSKKQLICLDHCGIREVLQEVIDLEDELCQRQNIRLICELQTDLPEIVGDYRQLRQVFLNLMSNARQVMQEGGFLTVRAMVGSLLGDKAVVVEVEDTGGGISPDIMRNIFNPFFSTFAKGTGLGLSISHRIIAQHHGAIEVVNAEKGARFIISLPVAQPGAIKRCED